MGQNRRSATITRRSNHGFLIRVHACGEHCRLRQLGFRKSRPPRPRGCTEVRELTDERSRRPAAARRSHRAGVARPTSACASRSPRNRPRPVPVRNRLSAIDRPSWRHGRTAPLPALRRSPPAVLRPGGSRARTRREGSGRPAAGGGSANTRQGPHRAIRLRRPVFRSCRGRTRGADTASVRGGRTPERGRCPRPPIRTRSGSPSTVPAATCIEHGTAERLGPAAHEGPIGRVRRRHRAEEIDVLPRPGRVGRSDDVVRGVRLLHGPDHAVATSTPVARPHPGTRAADEPG